MAQPNLSDVVDGPNRSEGQHAQAPAGDEAHYHPARQKQAVAEKGAEHVGARRHLQQVQVRHQSVWVWTIAAVRGRSVGGLMCPSTQQSS